MAAPTHTIRPRPLPGQPMKDGFRSLIAFANNASLLLWEKAVTGFGFDMGEPIDVNTMHSGTWFIERPRALSRTTPMNMRVAYAGTSLISILAQRGVEQAITQWFPSGNYVAFFGFLQSFVPDEKSEGVQPEANCVIKPTMWDPVNNVEADPVIGTGT